MKDEKIIIVLVVIVSLFVIFSLNFRVFRLIRGIEMDKIINEIYEVGEVKGIDINVVSGDIKIEKSEDEKVHVEVYSNKDSIKVSNDELLSIKEESLFKFFSFGASHKSRVILYLPKSYDLKIKTVSGDINSKIDMNSNVSISTTSGDIKLQSVDNLSVRTVSGDVTVNSCLINEIKTTSGDINIDEAIVKESGTIKSVSGDVCIKKLSDTYVEYKTTSGKTKIVNSDRKSDNVLNIKTTSGNIKIN